MSVCGAYDVRVCVYVCAICNECVVCDVYVWFAMCLRVCVCAQYVICVTSTYCSYISEFSWRQDSCALEVIAISTDVLLGFRKL